MRRSSLLVLSVVLVMLFLWTLGLDHGVTAAPLQQITATIPAPPGTTTPGTVTTATPVATTVLAAYPIPVMSFRVTRAGAMARLAWRMVRTPQVRGFDVLAKGHKLNRSLIRTHKSPNYRFQAPWKLHRFLKLRIVFSDGTKIGLSPIG